ncbi:MAG: hypothetical protein JWN40_5038 [Phycisphaerales bacterium]|nr:hypothetical protein [Phycisphaerales bacterium]
MMRREFTLGDFVAQMMRVQKLGPMGKVMGMMPGMGDMMKQVKMSEGDIVRSLKRMRAIYQSMTVAERGGPELIEAGRRRRIARGAGVEMLEVSKFIRDFEQSREMMRAVGRMRTGADGEMGRVLGLITENRTRRDPSLVYSNWSRDRALVLVVAGLVVAGLVVWAWERYVRGGGW